MASTTRTAAASTTTTTSRPAPADPREDLSTAASVLTSFSNSSGAAATAAAAAAAAAAAVAAAPPTPSPVNNMPVAYTPTLHRVSKAKKGKKVHACEYGCGKVFSRAEHRRRHEANHRSEPLYTCPEDGCEKTFQRPDLLTRHLERQHNYRPGHRAPPLPRRDQAPAANMRPHINPALDQLRYPQSPTSPTMNDFDVYGDEIRDLYLKQKWPLKDIKAYMEDKHSFAPLDDVVYEQAFARLCLQQLPAPGEEHRPELDPMLVAQSTLHHEQMRKAAAAGRTAEDTAALQRLNPSVAANAKDGLAGDNSGSETLDSRRQSDTPIKHDCPAPGCLNQGNDGFDTKEQLWGHMMAKHGVS